jgi:hypothetical protein
LPRSLHLSQQQQQLNKTVGKKTYGKVNRKQFTFIYKFNRLRGIVVLATQQHAPCTYSVNLKRKFNFPVIDDIISFVENEIRNGNFKKNRKMHAKRIVVFYGHPTIKILTLQKNLKIKLLF